MVDLNKVKSPDLWYVIGYIATDGNLSLDGRHINITSKDRAHLYLIRKALLLKNKIGRKSRGGEGKKNYSYLQFGDVKFYRFLNALGMTSNKSLTLGPLSVENNYFIDFLRGVIDGDGNISTWIHRTNLHVQWTLRIFSASSLFINWLHLSIKQHLEIDGRLYFKKRKDRKNGHFILKYGKISAKKILSIVYYNSCLSLERKYLKAQLCLQEDIKNGKLYT